MSRPFFLLTFCKPTVPHWMDSRRAEIADFLHGLTPHGQDDATESEG
jgi:hypothetical protein